MKTVAFGALALLAMSAAAYADNKPKFRICTGGETGNYYKAGFVIKSKAASSVDVEVISTKGSLDNLDKLVNKECDGAIVQADSMNVYATRNAAAIASLERSGKIFTEAAHLLCNRHSGINRVTDLTSKNTIAVGPDGSGGRTTWDSFIMADKKRYQPVNLDPRTGNRAIGAVADGSQVQCFFWVGSLGAPLMKDQAQQQGNAVTLVGTDDWDMGKALKDNAGNPVYGYEDIPSGTYPKIQPAGHVYGTQAVKVITVNAIFVGNTDYINNNEKAYDRVLSAIQSSGNDFNRIANGGQ